MSNPLFQKAPVVIFGLGGSGTRVVAKILSELNYYIGHDLNAALDNMTFTFLFRRPSWFYNQHINGQNEIVDGLNIFMNAMKGNSCFRKNEIRYFSSSIIDWYNQLGYKRIPWSLKRIFKIYFQKKIERDVYIGWGWKEPNAHIYFDFLLKYFRGNLKVIHVIRHGLDMAFSKNTKQLFNWHKLYGIDVPQKDEMLPNAMLKYWICANNRIVSVGEKLGDKNFLSINFDKLCCTPEKVISNIVDFIGVDIEKTKIQYLYDIPKKPKTIGRYKQYDLNLFDNEDLKFVRNLSFPIE